MSQNSELTIQKLLILLREKIEWEKKREKANTEMLNGLNFIQFIFILFLTWLSIWFYVMQSYLKKETFLDAQQQGLRFGVFFCSFLLFLTLINNFSTNRNRGFNTKKWVYLPSKWEKEIEQIDKKINRELNKLSKKTKSKTKLKQS